MDQDKKPTPFDIYKMYADRLTTLRQLMGVLLALTGALAGIAFNIWLKNPHAHAAIAAVIGAMCLLGFGAAIFWRSAQRLIKEFGASDALAVLGQWEVETGQAFVLPLDSLMTAKQFKTQRTHQQQNAKKTGEFYWWDRRPVLFSLFLMLIAAAAPAAIALASSVSAAVP